MRHVERHDRLLRNCCVSNQLFVAVIIRILCDVMVGAQTLSGGNAPTGQETVLQ